MILDMKKKEHEFTAPPIEQRNYTKIISAIHNAPLYNAIPS